MTKGRVEGPEKSAEEREERSAGWAVLCIFGVLFLTWGTYLAVVVALLLGQLPWLLAHEQPLNRPLAILCGTRLIPLCLLLALFGRTRLLAGMGFFLTSGLLTFVTCAACAMYVYYHWSWWGLILGSVLVGYGIMPTAALCAGTLHQWGMVGQIFSGGLLLFSCLYLGLTLMTLSFSADPVRPPHAE
ncbi:MAG: hypothetical protein JO250_01655 [Armatimonadetes bacterium]|nr:hypothetical protein [Armatimonadota bacterium]